MGRGREAIRRSPHQNMKGEGHVAQKGLQCPLWSAVNLWGPQRERTSEKWVSKSCSLAFTRLVLGLPNLEPCTGEASFRSAPGAQNSVEGRRVDLAGVGRRKIPSLLKYVVYYATGLFSFARWGDLCQLRMNLHFQVGSSGL